MAKKVQKRGECIFCGGHGLSKEHIWPRWMRPYFPVGPSSRHGVTLPDGFGYGKLTRPGDVRSQTLRVVCVDCNNGWMSGLQSLAKPYILSMIEQDKIDFSHEARSSIAAWAAMFTLVHEQAEPRLSSSTQSDRRFLMDNRVPSNSWRVLVTRSSPPHESSPSWRRMGHHKVTGEPAQVTMISLGSWVIFTLTGPDDMLEDNSFGALTCIWPHITGAMYLGNPMTPQYIDAAVPAFVPDSTGFNDTLMELFAARVW